MFTPLPLSQGKRYWLLFTTMAWFLAVKEAQLFTLPVLFSLITRYSFVVMDLQNLSL